MDCNEAEDLLMPFLVGTLDPEEHQMVESHLRTCRTCRHRLQAEGETVATLALDAPQLEPPPGLKQRLFSRIDAEKPAPQLSTLVGRLLGLQRDRRRQFLAPATGVLATAVVAGLVFGGIWFNGRLNQVSESHEELTGQLETVVEGEAQVKKMVAEQRYFSSMTAAPGVSVNMLRGTAYSTDAWGMIACCAVSEEGTVALLSVMNVPTLPGDKIYQVWLIRQGQRYSAGVFTVDSTGYGQAVIRSVIPFGEVEDIGITVEPAGGSLGPTGSKVLERDL